MSKDEKLLVFTIITLGDSGVGKTSIIRRYLYDIFEDTNLSTIGLQFSIKKLTLKNKKTIKLKLIDTGGQEKFRSLSKSYYRNADAALFVFSVNDMDSFEKINEWINEFRKNQGGEEKIPIYLIGNKKDLEQKVEQNLIDELETKFNFKYISTSALKNENIDLLFAEIGEELFKRYDPVKNQKNIKIAQEKKNKESFCDKCNGY